MKYIITLMITLAVLVDPGKIARINTYKKEAKKAYLEGDFKTAITKYRYLVDSLKVNEEEVLMNLANAYYQANDTAQALSGFQSLSQSRVPAMRSKAEQQLGVMANKQGKTEEALDHFKQAVKADPTNEDARYNYELLKKKLEEKKKQEQQKQNQDQQKKDQNKEQQEKDKQDQEKKEQQDKKDQQKKEEQDKKDQQKQDQQKDDQQKQDEKEKQDKEQKEKEQKEKEQKEQQEKEKKELPKEVMDKLKQMNMSEEKARMILEAMKNQEIQYLQQNKRKTTKPRERGKPDW